MFAGRGHVGAQVGHGKVLLRSHGKGSWCYAPSSGLKPPPAPARRRPSRTSSLAPWHYIGSSRIEEHDEDMETKRFFMLPTVDEEGLV